MPTIIYSAGTHILHRVLVLPLLGSYLWLCESCGVLLTDVLVFQFPNVTVTIKRPWFKSKSVLCWQWTTEWC